MVPSFVNAEIIISHEHASIGRGTLNVYFVAPIHMDKHPITQTSETIS